MYKHIIFDLDGTILNTLEDLASATNWVCARHGWPVHEVEEFKYFVGNGAPKLLSRVVPDGVERTSCTGSFWRSLPSVTTPTRRTKPQFTPGCPRP